LELHIDQSRDAALAGAPAVAVARLAARLRLQVELCGQADHAGTTQHAERRDALATAARLIVHADDLAADLRMVFTAARVEVEPNAPTTVPSLVRLWLDARAPDPRTVEAWREDTQDGFARIATSAGVELTTSVASWSPGTEFLAAVRDALTASLPGAP